MGTKSVQVTVNDVNLWGGKNANAAVVKAHPEGVTLKYSDGTTITYEKGNHPVGMLKPGKGMGKAAHELLVAFKGQTVEAEVIG